MKVSLEGRAAIVTGGSRGLGLEIARALAVAGADVMLCARDAAPLAQAEQQIRSAAPGRQVACISADVADPESANRVVAETLKQWGRCDILVNNAGIYGPKGLIELLDWEAWEQAVRINLFGSIHMCRAVLPHMKQARSGKIIQLSGGGATNPMARLTAYAVSKAGAVRFAESLAEEVREFGIDVNSIAPGALNTRLLDEVIAVGPEAVGQSFYDRALKQRESGGAPIDEGAKLAVFLASDLSNGISGRLISAVWDDWRAWPEHKAELAESDAWTLRRITGRDRNLGWGDK